MLCGDGVIVAPGVFSIDGVSLFRFKAVPTCSVSCRTGYSKSPGSAFCAAETTPAPRARKITSAMTAATGCHCIPGDEKPVQKVCQRWRRRRPFPGALAGVVAIAFLCSAAMRCMRWPRERRLKATSGVNSRPAVRSRTAARKIRRLSLLSSGWFFMQLAREAPCCRASRQDSRMSFSFMRLLLSWGRV